MDIDIGKAIQDGFERTFEKNGLMLAGLYFIATLLSTVSANSVSMKLVENFGPAMDQAAMSSQQVLTLPVPLPVSSLVFGVSLLASSLLSIVAIRTLVSSETELVPTEYYSKNLLMPLLHLIGGGIVFSLMLIGALAIPTAPGLLIAGLGVSTLIGGLIGVLGFLVGLAAAVYLSIGLYYWTFEVVTEDTSFLEGFENSWELTSGNKLPLLGLMILTSIITTLVGWVLSAPSLVGLQVVGTVLSLVGSAFGAVFTLAVFAQAYNQLK